MRVLASLRARMRHNTLCNSDSLAHARSSRTGFGEEVRRVGAAVPAHQLEVSAPVVAAERTVAFERARVSARTGRAVRTDAVRPAAGRSLAAHARPTLLVEAAEQLLVLAHQPAGLLGVCGRYDVAVLIFRDREQAV